MVTIWGFGLMLSLLPGVIAGGFDPSTPVPTDYIHKYTFDNITGGTTLVDEGSAAVNGTINAGVTAGLIGINGDAAHFDGSDNGNVDVTGISFWTGAHSYFALVYVDALNKSFFTAGKSRGAVNERDYDVYVQSDGTFQVVASNGSSYIINVASSPGVIAADNWYLLEVKWDGTTDAGGVILKVNNSVVATGAATGSPRAVNTPYIGGRETLTAFEFLGFHDDLWVYDYFLTDSQDTAVYNELFEGYVATGGGIPTPPDDNVIYEEDVTVATGWSSYVTSDGTQQTYTPDGTTSSNVEKTIAGPKFGDYILYATIRADSLAANNAVNLAIGQTGSNPFIITLGYNRATASYEQNRVSIVIGSTGFAGPLIDYSANDIEIAVQYDSRVGAGNFFVKEAGAWEFYGAASMSSPYKNFIRYGAGGGFDMKMYIKELFIAYPNYAVIGDSIAAGHNEFDPDPSYYAGIDDYTNTWMYYAGIGSTVRNNLIVNYGIGSQFSSELLARTNDALARTQARTVFVHASTKDSNTPVAQATRTTNIQDTLNLIAKWGRQSVLLNAIYSNSGDPNYPQKGDYNKEWWDDYQPSIVRAASKLDIMGGSGILDGNYMDTLYTASDGVHLNQAGNELVGDYIQTQE